MSKLPILEAAGLLATLDKVRRTALRAGVQDARWKTSVPLEELRCLVSFPRIADDAEEHLWNVGAMALRDVQMLVYMRRWNMGAGFRTFPHDFDRLVERRATDHVGDPYPCVTATSIAWAEPGEHLPPEVWITHREIRRLAGDFRTRTLAAIHARYGTPMLGFTLMTATMADDEA